MSEAPERIWAGNWLADVGETATWDMGEWRNEPWPTVNAVEYVRAGMLQEIFARYSKAEADRIEELEAKLAKLEAAAQKAVGHITGYGEASTARIELRTTLAELTGGKDE